MSSYEAVAAIEQAIRKYVRPGSGRLVMPSPKEVAFLIIDELESSGFEIRRQSSE